MTLSQIMTLALRQLDEDPQDISEYDDLFRTYANEGYRIAMDEYVKPRQTRSARSDGEGRIYPDSDVRRVVELREKRDGGIIRRNTPYALSADGTYLETSHKNEDFILVVEVAADGMENETDEPAGLEPQAQAALADYICFRHLSNGNMAKQSKAQFYRQQFYQTMSRLRPHGFGSVRGYRNLYEATDIRAR